MGDCFPLTSPSITPVYLFISFLAVKCNPNPNILKLLVTLGSNFDCASVIEMQAVLKYNISPQQIIFANPVKAISEIQYAKHVNVDKMTFDCEHELLKIEKYYPTAKCVLRIKCDASDCLHKLGEKFGCNPDVGK